MTSNAIPHYWDMHRCSRSWLLSWRGQNSWLITGIWWHTSIRFHLHSTTITWYHMNEKHLNYWMMMFSNPSWIPDFFCGFISHSVNRKHHHSWVPTVAYSNKHQIQTSSELHYWWTTHFTFQDGWLNMIGFSVCSLVLCCIPTWSWKTFCDVSTEAFGRNVSKSFQL